MFIVKSYLLAVIFCFITMMCWGSWGNTQKLASKNWRYELFYWDYVIGMVLFSLLISLTMGSIGSEGRPFLADLAQADMSNIMSVILGGIIFNASNILLSASTSIAGLAVAFPLGVGLSLVLGVIINYLGAPKGDPIILFAGVALIVIAIICNGIASGKVQKSDDGQASSSSKKGIILAIVAGVLMSFFYRFVAKAMDLNSFESPAAGMLTPYSAIFVFSIGVLLSNFIFNTFVMKKPFVGEPVTYSQYFKGNFKTHLVGMLGGAIWCLGTAFSYIASGKAGAAVSYALGQGAPLIAAIWGVFIWKEFKGADKKVYSLLAIMFALFIGGLGCIIVAGQDDAEAAAVTASEKPVKMIIETDMGNDIDDALALAVALKAADAGEIELLAVGCHKLSGTPARYVDIVNTYYGHPKVAVAMSKTPVKEFTDYVDYTVAPCEMGFKESLAGEAQEPVSLYRKLLAESEDGSICFVSLGFGITLAQLLESQPDEISPLSGVDLVARKVKYLSIMAGSYGEKKRAEFNVTNDIPSMQKVFESWPGTIYQNPFEIGKQVSYPGSEIEANLGFDGLNPVVEAYKLYREMPYDRPSWDILSVIFVTNPEMFTLSAPGRVTVDDEGYTHYTADPEGSHYVLSATIDQPQALKAKMIEMLRQ